MITPFQIYLISTSDSFSLFFGIISAILLVFLITIFVALLGNYRAYQTGNKENEDIIKVEKKLKKAFKWCASVLLITLFSITFMPSSKTVAAMYVLPKIDSPDLEKLPKNAAKFANAWLKEEIKEIADEGSNHD